jgi:hypothetical protein
LDLVGSVLRAVQTCLSRDSRREHVAVGGEEGLGYTNLLQKRPDMNGEGVRDVNPGNRNVSSSRTVKVESSVLCWMTRWIDASNRQVE